MKLAKLSRLLDVYREKGKDDFLAQGELQTGALTKKTAQDQCARHLLAVPVVVGREQVGAI